MKNVTAFQRDNKVFEGLNITIKAGEKVAILGPNGAGKSTFLKLITREIYPVVKDDSHVRLFGKERFMLTDLRKRLGMVSQDLQEDYTPYTTALEVIASGFVGAIGHHDHLSITPEQMAIAQEQLANVGMQDFRDTMFQRLSTGQKRRLLVGRALVHDPEMLIFDEPSNGLDITAAAALLNLMRRYATPTHTLLLTTHHIDEVIPEIERVILIKKGQVIADGPKDEVLTSEILSEMYQVPVSLQSHNGWYRLWLEN
ncbi:ABC transporter ATP-binding protein [Pokkaliibacter sp. CJK22405]|uniref:ABC transporter ATP-binding protein n=1 Tax=Pokkaliibacter sp. CJK22405 TaxID=3384615 RepID=UPI003985206D